MGEAPHEDVTIVTPRLSETEIRTLLASLGYAWSLRDNGWSECLVERGQERWVGQGTTRESAWRDVLDKMCPSALAQHLLARVRDVIPGAAPLAREVTRVEPAAIVVPAEPFTVSEALAARVAVDTSPPERPVNGVATATAPTAPTPIAAAAPSEPAPSESRLKRFPGPPTPVNLRRTDEDVSELELLDERLRSLLPEMAGFSRDLQRLAFIAFIARARHISQRNPDARVEAIVRRIAGRLGELAEQFWPGSVRALQLRATPLQAGADMDLPDGGRLHDWAEAAEAAERLVEEKRTSLDKRGLDESGWADLERCFPPPNDPDTRLDELRNAMEKAFGRLDQRSPSEADRELQHATDKILPELLKWARELRWLRPHVEDRVRWGQAIGRLRWASTRLPREHRASLEVLLNEEHRPTRPWAHELGQDPIAKQRKKLRKALLQKKPEGERATPEAVSQWLVEAFDLGDSFSTSEIAERIPGWFEIVLALPTDEATGKDRKYRRRLKILQDEIDRRQRGETTPRPANEDEVEVEVSAQSLEQDEGDLAFRRLLARVRERIEGKSALFVSNRADPLLKERLERELGVQIEWAEIDPRRIQSRIESVRRMSYDLVLSATGFQGHSIDATLGRETKACGLPYVRVNRGRLTTCVRAIARQFGLLEAA